jgi:uncharacterized RDD family membrane protein YckC
MSANQKQPLGPRQGLAGLPPDGLPLAGTALAGFEPSVRLDLPEQGSLELPLAGVGSRGLATLIDLSWLCSGPAWCVFAAWLIQPAWLRDAGVRNVLFALGLLLPSLGPLALELWQRGQSPGKRRVGIRVVSLDGHAVTSSQLILRNILRIVDFLPIGYLLGVASLFVSEKGQRLGDVVAGTLVVRDGRRALEDVRGIQEAAPAGPELHGIPASLLMAVRLLIDPARDLAPEIRKERQSQVVEAVRACRGDLIRLTDDELWAWLEAGLRA